MIELIIQKQEAGRQLARFLEKIFPKAPKSLFFKALRNKKIKINGKKPPDLSVLLQEGDEVRLFFTAEQLLSFGYREAATEQEAVYDLPAVPVLYEDENLIIFDKPAGLLSQKSRLEDVSLTEIGRQMILAQNGRSASYRPGVCNRLDRNTAGAVIMAKNVETGQAVSQMLKDHTLGKFYWALVEGVPVKWQEETSLVHIWHKDTVHNKAVLYDESDRELLKGEQRIESVVHLIQSYGKYSLVEVRLLTGKSHQIRSQLAHEGHPIIGDGKYNPFSKRFMPMLVAKRLVFNHCPKKLAYLEGKVVEASLPNQMGEWMQ